MAFDIAKELKKLPDRPGVYLMHDTEGRILYVGKATSLKNRVKSYFAKTVNRGPQILKMIREIAWFETIITDSPTEALILECNLIKEYNPPYNTRLTDDKAYPWISLSVNEAYPRAMLARRIERDGREYFGPYTDVTAVRETLRLIQSVFNLRTCKKKLPESCGKERPCLNYDMGLCPAPCRGTLTQEEYGKNVERARQFLKGNYEPVIKTLREKMLAASDAMEFEEAAKLRDLIGSIQKLDDRQKLNDTDMSDRDIAAVAAENGEGIVEFFFIRGGRMIGRTHYHLTVSEEDSPGGILAQVLQQFYSGTPYLPHEILTAIEPENKVELETALSAKNNRKVEIRTPKIGEKKRLVELAQENARRALKEDRERIAREAERTAGAQSRLCALIGLSGVHRVEAYDISHISGYATVGSMVVYEDGQPRKNEYRKFRIRFSQGPNDVASLTEVLHRRFSHGLEERQSLRESGLEEESGSFVHFPDLILMDGGEAQVHAAEAVLTGLRLCIPVCGMVKDDHHRTRALLFGEKEVPIDPRSPEFKLLTRIQDETHRFAIEYHRSLRSKDQVHSVLDDIPGVGPARRKALMREFAGPDEIRAASTERLAAVPGFNRSAARKVYAFFHDGEVED